MKLPKMWLKRAALLLALAPLLQALFLNPPVARAAGNAAVATAAELVTAIADPDIDEIVLKNDITLSAALAIAAANARNITFKSDVPGTERAILTTNTRHFSFSGATAEIDFVDVALKGGGTSGGMEISGGTLQMNGLAISNCRASNGGAILVSGAAVLTIIDGSFSRNVANSAGNRGGAIYASGGSTLRIEGSRFSENELLSGGQGGAICIAGANTKLDVENCDFLKNKAGALHANSRGGAIAALESAYSLYVNNCSFEENSDNTNGDDVGGGAVYISTAPGTIDVKLANSSFIKNQSRSSGGGVGIYASATVEINGCEFKENSVTGASGSREGGGLFSQSSAVTIKGDTLFEGNSAVYGGGLDVSGTLNIVGNLSVKNNRSTTGLGGGLYCYSCVVTVSGTAEFINNSAASTASNTRGGGICMNSAGSLTVSPGGTLSLLGNTVPNGTGTIGGGGIYSTVPVTVNGKLILEDNAAKTNGGGAYTTAAFTANGEVLIKNNSAAGTTGGGGLYSTAAVALNGSAQITGNRAPSGDGGGIYNTAALTNVTASADVLFANNLARAGYDINVGDIATHEVKILTDAFSYGFVYGYNNHDINYRGAQAVNNVTLTYDNGLTGSENEQFPLTLRQGASVNLAAIANVGGEDWSRLPRHRFDGWNDGSADYGAGEGFAVNANTTMTALWTPLYYVTYDGNGATGGAVPTDETGYAQGEPVAAKGNPGALARSGYSFLGWSLAPGGAAVSGFAMPGANQTLYAVWKAKGGPIGDGEQTTPEPEPSPSPSPSVSPSPSPEAPLNPGVPATGDGANLALWAGLLAASLFALLFAAGLCYTKSRI
jgi:predicted outer membrane repeat protein